MAAEDIVPVRHKRVNLFLRQRERILLVAPKHGTAQPNKEKTDNYKEKGLSIKNKETNRLLK